MSTQHTYVVHDTDDKFKQTIGRIEARYAGNGFVFGLKANRDNDKDYGHWYAPVITESRYFKYDLAALNGLMERNPDVAEAWSYIQNILGKRALLRVYINGYTFGADGTLHVDDPWIQEEFGPDMPSETCVVYLNKTWDNNWAGETVVFDDDGEIEKAVIPKHGRMFIFDSKKVHGARPVTRVCPVLRSVLVFKTADISINSPIMDFLLINTANKKYKGHDVLDYSMLVSRNAENRGAKKDVCSAALYHLVYNEEVVGQTSPFTREIVRDIIGEYAEKILHTYHTSTIEQVLAQVPETVDEKQLLVDVASVYFAVLITDNDNNQHIETLVRIADKLDSIY